MAFPWTTRGRTRRAFNKARRSANRTGGMVCYTALEDGTPVYWVMPTGATDEQVALASFKQRYGRSPADHEQFVMSYADKLRARASA